MVDLVLGVGAVLLGLWILGIVCSCTLGGFIYAVLVIGLILVGVGIAGQISRRRR